MASARRAWPGAARAGAALAAAHAAVAGPEAPADPLADLTAAAGFLAAALPSRRAVAPVGARVRARCVHIATAGPLRLLGAGAVDCDLDVGGDLHAIGTGGGVRGGTVRGGRPGAGPRAGRRGAGAPLRIVLDAPGTLDDVLVADVVGAGVEVTAGGATLRFDRRRTRRAGGARRRPPGAGGRRLAPATGVRRRRVAAPSASASSVTPATTATSSANRAPRSPGAVARASAS